MRALRIFAALFVVLTAASYPILIAAPALGDALSEYHAQVSAATALVAQDQAHVDSATADVATRTTALLAAQQAATDGSTAVATAQSAYDASSVPVVVSSGSGIHVDIYNNTLKTFSPNQSNLCRSDVFTQISANWGAGSVAGCNNDRVTIHYTGTITVPDTGAYKFMNIADDGFYMTLDGQTIINDWRDKGCGGSWSQPIQLVAGSAHTFDAWYYENGGGACSTLYVTQPSGNYQVVPASWFGQATTTVNQKDPALLTAVQAAQTTLDALTAAVSTAQDALNSASTKLSEAQAALVADQAALSAIPVPVINAPQNLTAKDNGDGSITLTWDAPTTGVIPERYAVMWSDTSTAGWGVASVPTSVTLPTTVIAQDGLGKTYTFKIRSDNDSAQMYSGYSNSVDVVLSAPIVPVLPPVVPVPDSRTIPAPVSSPEPSPQPTVDTSTLQAPNQGSDSQTIIAPSDTQVVSVDTPTVIVDTPTAIVVDDSTVTVDVPVQPLPQPAPQPQPEPVALPQPAPEPAPAETPSPAPSPAPTPEPSSDALPAPEPKPTDIAPTPPDPSPTPQQPAPAPQPSPSPMPAPSSQPEVTPSPQPTQPSPAPTPSTPTASSGNLIPNSPDQLSDTTPKEAPAEVLVVHVQVDKPGVENGGIEFFGTKSQPQVVGEDGKLTPPAPPPGSGLPIPPDAITTSATFIGQPGGTTFNAPDIAVPVVETPVTGALAVVPGVQALNHAFVAMANIGNDMSPVTRKKAKKILVATLVAGQIAQLRRRY